jgi:hypothetical protein
MRIVMIDAFLVALASLPAEQRIAALLAVAEIREAFRNPHAQSGLGLRKIGRNLWEIRAGLHSRIIFRLNHDLAEICLIGNHDDVHRFLKSQ